MTTLSDPTSPLLPPPLPSGRIVLKPPPELRPAEGASGVLTNAVPMLGGLGSVLLVATMGGGADGLRLVAAGMFLVATVGFLLVQVDRQRTQRTQQVDAARADYLHHLASVRARAREAGDRQRATLAWHHPAPAALPALAAQRSRVWERTVGAPRFLQVRCGVAARPSDLEVLAHEDSDAARADPVAVAAAQRLLAVHRTQPDLPVTVDLAAQDRLEVVGPPDQARAVVRALVCSAAAFHPPDALAVAVLAEPAALAHWDWVKWLPHAHSPHPPDAIGPRRLVGASVQELRPLLPAHPHLLVVLDDGGRHDRAALELPGTGVTLLRVRASDPADPADRVRLVLGTDPVGVEPDRCDLASAEALARRLLPLGTAGGERPGTRSGGARPTSPPCSVPGTSASWTRRSAGAHARSGTGCGCRSAPGRTAASSTSTSRSRPAGAWARTAWSSAPPDRASPSCCGPWCWGSGRPTPPPSSTWC